MSPTRIASCVAFVLALALPAACGDATTSVMSTTDVSLVASSVAGTWARTTTVPGASLRFMLAVVPPTDSILTGTGTYAIEAGRSGTLTVNGKSVGTHVTLGLTYDYGVSAQASLVHVSADTLSGSIVYYDGPGVTSGSGPMTVKFSRVR